jgi:hypothetical protein
MIKFLLKIFKKNDHNEQEGKHLSDEEKFIIANDPHSVHDVEYFGRIYQQIQNQHRSWSAQ